MEVFLDRSGDVFCTVLAYLRDGSLPPHVSLPTIQDVLTPASVDPTTLTLFALHPPAPLALLALLRDLATEAQWLGLDALVEVCKLEKERVGEVVRWLEEKARKDIVDERQRREKDGWV